jgi:hypothetical protein
VSSRGGYEPSLLAVEDDAERFRCSVASCGTTTASTLW